MDLFVKQKNKTNQTNMHIYTYIYTHAINKKAPHWHAISARHTIGSRHTRHHARHAAVGGWHAVGGWQAVTLRHHRAGFLCIYVKAYCGQGW